MQEQRIQLIQAIHDADPRMMLVFAGAGTEALSCLLGVAGATRTVLEALVPYSTASFDEFLGQSPAKYVHGDTANLLAGRAYTRARLLEDQPVPSVGVACTATIITDRPKRGKHRAYIATWQMERLVQIGIYLEKGARDRAGEENVVSALILNGLARSMAIDTQLPVALTEKDKLEEETIDFTQPVQQLYRREVDYLRIMPDGRVQTRNSHPHAILSGSFNPLHDGHLAMAKVAQRILGEPVAFECSAINAEKPELPQADMLERAAQFAGRWPIFITNASTFAEKAQLFPYTTFVVGYDTAERILQPRFYDNSTHKMIAAMKTIRDQGCSFLVAGRLGEDGYFRSRDHLAIPQGFELLFRSIPPAKFRKDISSTELRRRGKRGSR